MKTELNRTKVLPVLVALLLASGGCKHQTPSMKLKRASFNRCIYQVEQRSVCWDVRAFVNEGNDAEGEEFIISCNLVVEDYDDLGPFERIFQLKKVRVYFGTDMVYQGKGFDHDDWLGPSLNSSNNMLRLDKKKMGRGNLSVVLWTEDDMGRTYECEAGNVPVGKI